MKRGQPKSALAIMAVVIAGLCSVLAVCPGTAAPERQDPQVDATPEPADTQDVMSIDTCKTDLTRRLRAVDVPGMAAAIVKNGRIVCTAVAGMANIEQQRPVTPDTLFLIASVSKTITATALMQLYDEGKFQLGDDINRYLPFRVRIPVAPNAPITFQQLLTHTASIKDNTTYINCPGSCAYGSSFVSLVTRGADSPISLADLARGYLTPGGAYYNQTANFESRPPGTISDYSNMGIALAGYLVELISGTPFDQYCKDNIFAPLGMDKTSWRLTGIDESLLAMPYNKTSSGFVPYGQYGEPDYPDGMLRTSVTELARFLIAYMDDGRYNDQQILKSTTVKDMLKVHSSRNPSQGFVWFKRSINGRTVWGHDGSDNGAGAEMWFDPAKDQGVILVTNGVWNDVSHLLSSFFREADHY